MLQRRFMIIEKISQNVLENQKTQLISFSICYLQLFLNNQ